MRTNNPSAEVRIRTMKRDRFQCTYCGAPGTDAELEIDHIIPVARGGSHHISNLTTACRTCNQKKGANSLPIPSLDAPLTPARLIGLWLHTINDKKEIVWQGEIIGVEGDDVIVQLFSWLSGDPGVVKVLSRSLILSDKCNLYRTNAAMIAAYEVYSLQKWGKHY